MNKDAVVVFSGGQDSTTCLYWAKHEFAKVYALCFSYGQKHSAEVVVAQSIAGEAGVPFRLIDLPFIGGLAHNSLTDTDMKMDDDVPQGGVPNTFVPGRNLFFLSVAAVVARAHCANGVVDFLGVGEFTVAHKETDVMQARQRVHIDRKLLDFLELDRDFVASA